MSFSTEEMAAAATTFFPLPPASPSPPPPNFSNSRPLPPPSDLFNIPNVPRIGEFLNNNHFNFDLSNGYVPPAPNPPLLRGFARMFFPNGLSTAKTSSNVGTYMTQTMSGDCLIGELKRENQRKRLSLMKLFLACQKYQQFLIIKILR